MLRLIVTLAAAAGMLIPPAMSLAGMNPEAKLAMHLIASADSLGWEVLSPAACESIDADLSLGELFEAGGYGYILLLAYHVEAVSGVEFAISGWPTGRGAPVLNGPYWIEEDATTFGDHLADGGATGLGTCVEPDAAGLIPLAYLTFGPLDSTDVPITLEFLPSVYTDPEDSLLAVTDCTEEYVADRVVLATGCAIGETYTGPMPECGEHLDGGEGGMAEEDGFEWPVIVETGTLYAYGNRLEPPYVFTYENERMLANGVQIVPDPARGTTPAEEDVPDWFRMAHQLNEQVTDLARNLLQQGSPPESISRAAADLYESSPLVDSVRVHADMLIVHWRGDHFPLWVTLPKDLAPRPPMPTMRQISKNLVNQLAQALRPGWVVFYGAGYQVAVPHEDAAAALQILRECGDPQAEALGLLAGPAARDILYPRGADAR